MGAPSRYGIAVARCRQWTRRCFVGRCENQAQYGRMSVQAAQEGALRRTLKTRSSQCAFAVPSPPSFSNSAPVRALQPKNVRTVASTCGDETMRAPSAAREDGNPLGYP